MDVPLAKKFEKSRNTRITRLNAYMYTIIATNSVLITKIEIIICNILDCSYIYLILIITIGKKIVNDYNTRH